MTIRAVFLLVAVVVARAAEPNTLSDAERREGWRLLFDGKSTAGWLEVTGKPFPANCWTVVDGALKALVRTNGFQDIRTTDTFGSFDLQFEWKILPLGNSGVKYFVQKVDEWTNAAGRQARARGLEYQLADDATAGSLYSQIAPSPRVAPRIGEYNQSRIVVRGRRVEHWLNGVKVADFDAGALTPPIRIDPSPISLQNHSSETWFRNIKIRPL